ncbi:MAG: pseudaminic acid synthase [Chloroflexi bacterium]|nr:pseudaminic acid synthase [Chloroflexota bacterium]
MTSNGKPYIEINGRRVGPGYPAYIVAEMSANHNQDFEQAVAIIKAAKDAGADAVKLQTYTPDTLTIDCDAADFKIPSGNTWEGQTLYELYGQAYTPWEWHPRLKRVADDFGIELFSAPFDATAVDLLEEMDVSVYKIASFEIVDIPLVQRVARTGKPMIISTGMATLAQIDEAVQAARGEGNDQLILMKCTSAYPAPPQSMNIRTIPHLSQAFGVPSGLSDHSMGTSIAVAAVALGASMIEKHFTLSRDEDGPDSAFSLEPHELRELVGGIRTVESALGDVHYAGTEAESSNKVFRRSLYVVADVESGETFTERNVRSIRPGYGMPPRYLPDVLGRKAAKGIKRGTAVSWELVAG